MKIGNIRNWEVDITLNEQEIRKICDVFDYYYTAKQMVNSNDEIYKQISDLIFGLRRDLN